MPKNDFLYVEKTPIWLEKLVNTDLIDKSIINFFIIYAPFEDSLSSQNINMTNYGWSKDWYNDMKLIEKLNSELSKKDVNNIIMVDSKSKLKEQCTNELYNNKFYENLSRERAIFAKKKHPGYSSLFYHIRCSLAHGRFQIVKSGRDYYYIMENIEEINKLYALSARIILKRSTLKKWIEDIIKSGSDYNEK